MKNNTKEENKVVYHSELWEILVELGWRTVTVETVDGSRLATMTQNKYL